MDNECGRHLAIPSAHLADQAVRKNKRAHSLVVSDAALGAGEQHFSQCVVSLHPNTRRDEADSFVRDNEEMRGVLNSGHTKAAAYVIRNVEVNGEFRPQRFSTWAPKAIATIRALADTLEDRSIVVQLQRKPRAASVARLRRRDNEGFARLRSQAARWAADNFARLTDPDPSIPDALNDRAADNWRPLFAIADLAGGEWPTKAREAACILSGEGHDAAINVRLLVDTREAFGDLDAIRSADLADKLNADPEKPWVEWHHGKPLTQKQLAGLLRPFGVVSETVSAPGQKDAKGYKRARFKDVWEQYCPVENGGQNPPSPSSQAFGGRIHRHFALQVRSTNSGWPDARCPAH
jgi:putative DNA primase/helicase